jgi:hypothetical protein
LWSPAPGAYGAHGRFDDRSRDVSVELWLAKRKPWLALAGAIVAGVALSGVRGTDRL